MKSFLLLALLSASEIEVRPGESLAQLAQRALGSPTGASELKALNGLKDDAPPRPGTKLKLPGPERDLAQKALDSARNSVHQSDAHFPRHDEAIAKLKEAEGLFQQARYDEAAQAADGAWKLASERPPQPTKMSVMVDDKGATTVKAVSGRVTVEAGGATRVLDNGGTLQVEKGQTPRALLRVPQPTQPADKQRLTQPAIKSGAGLEPIVISWQGVEGAERYEVELVSEGGDKRVLPSTELQLKVALAAGAYRWSVRALAHEDRSAASTEQGFEVAQAPTKPLNLKIKSSNKWK